jgi:hypothetical protein
MGRIFKYLGSKESARQLWENREALEMYLTRLKELWDEDTGEWLPSSTSDNAELQAKKLSNENTSDQI